MGLAEKLLEHYKQGVDALELRPGDGGRFEVFVDGDEVYSKLKTGGFPEFAAIRKAVDRRVKA